MPWPRDHKSRTRERILRAAAEAFRARGVPDVSVEEIMAGAGLTRGGFYAHFASKDDLLHQSLEHASRETVESLADRLKSAPAERRLHLLVDAYLGPEHVAHPERGCLVAALGPELTRGSPEVRHGLASGVRRRLTWMRSLLPKERRGRRPDEEIIGAFACMVGGVVLARAFRGKESTALLEACRAFLHRALAPASSGATVDRRGATRPSRGKGRRPRVG
jgi:TetR/AcrR family transcriptional regulator, transcriptional repressor for nem operon